MSNENEVSVNKKKRLPRPGDGQVSRGSAKSRSRGGQKLKSERVQLAAERVQELLVGMPGWGLAKTGQAIGREWHFPRPRVAAAYAAYVAGLAAVEGQTVHLVLSGAAVSLTVTSRLRGGSREGLTENAFRFAARLG